MSHHDQRENTGWNFENTYITLPEKLFTMQKPIPVHSPQLVMFNEPLAKSLGLNPESLGSKDVAVFAGNELPDGSSPLAQAYAGHQFGHFTMLGDGRAVLLGEQITPGDERFDIQLKGSGRTPYSRGGDGRASLGPMLREYIISEAMHALRIPTTRSLAVVTTGETVLRETQLPGAILTRVAASHLRVGTFQYVANWGTEADMESLVDYTLHRHFPKVNHGENRYLALFREVVKQQASVIAKWQLVGFVHGVMNTDNMTISGETIDYGPCAFMDHYDENTVFSSIDREGRYSYGNQPGIGQWNLARFAETLLPFINSDEEKAIESAKEVLTEYAKWYHENWLNGMRAKLGLFDEGEDDQSLIEELLQLMKQFEADFTNTFRSLTFEDFEDNNLFHSSDFKYWYKKWNQRKEREEQSKSDSVELMKNHNPAVIPRNHQVEEALQAAVERNDYSVMERLLDVLSNPYAHTKEQEQYTTVPKRNRPYITYCGT
ncbi:protein adenylyltransferase SelO [Salirhabdus salicampi]|uniref:protein adenylyltransferase SelO n=1 Tax=Salirhabdus salicampi TaxID=476102 RepID=UPI0020C52B33|nr:YdiU family protein [Salirhabdus salicampi]MCP8616301.1 YdiU family protein [Salirhabdus salicampi]